MDSLSKYDVALSKFIELLNERNQEYHKVRFPNIEAGILYVHSGSKYDKVILDNGSRSSYCYINRENGDILKGNWKGVERPIRARGNIFAKNPLAGTNVYGVDYIGSAAKYNYKG